MVAAPTHRLERDVRDAADVVLSLDELGDEVLPIVEDGLELSASLLYRCDEHGAPVAVAGSLAASAPEYYEDFVAQDRVQDLVSRSAFTMPARLPGWTDYLRGVVYNEFLRPRGMHYLVHVRVLGNDHHEPGMVGMLLTHSAGQPDFDAADEAALRHIIPSLTAAARRGERWQAARRTQRRLEELLSSDRVPRLAFGLDGTLLWASRRAEVLLGTHRQSEGGAGIVALAEAARRMGVRLERRASFDVPAATVPVPRADSEPLRATLQPAVAESQPALIVAELDDPDGPPMLDWVAARCELTGAETRVLALLAAGLGDREIGRELWISQPTVRTHVTRILRKLGARSRLQAALVAHGHTPRLTVDEPPP